MKKKVTTMVDYPSFFGLYLGSEGIVESNFVEPLPLSSLSEGWERGRIGFRVRVRNHGNLSGHRPRRRQRIATGPPYLPESSHWSGVWLQQSPDLGLVRKETRSGAMPQSGPALQFALDYQSHAQPDQNMSEVIAISEVPHRISLLNCIGK